MATPHFPMTVPVYLPGQEPLPAGFSEADRAALMQQLEWGKMAGRAMESCPTKCAMSGAAGFVLGGFFSLLSASFAIDDPLRRSNLAAASAGGVPLPELSTSQSTKLFFKETGKSMYSSARGFGKVGALYAGIECCIEGVSVGASKQWEAVVRRRIRRLIILCSQYRAKNDMVNPVSAGALAGAILARSAGPKAMVGGGIAFAAFSAAIDLYVPWASAVLLCATNDLPDSSHPVNFLFFRYLRRQPADDP